MFNNIKIGTKILIIMLVTSLASLMVISVISYTEMLNLTKYSQDANIQLGITASGESQQALLNQAEEYLAKIAVEQAGNSDAILSQIEAELASVKDYLEGMYANPSNFVGYELPLPDENQMDVSSAKYMLPPGVEQTDLIEKELLLLSNAGFMLSAVLKNDENLDNIYLGTHTGISYRYSSSNAYNPDYDPRERDWFTQALLMEGEEIWLDTYVDPYGSIGVTCATTFNGADGKVAGVVATDITLTSLKQSIIETKIGDDGYAFLLDNKGEFIAHPDYESEDFKTNPLTTAEESFKETITEMSMGESGIKLAIIDDVESYIAFAPIETASWSLGVVVSIDKVTLPSKQTKEKIDAYTVTSQAHIHDTLSSILMRFIILFAVCTMVLVFFSFILSKTITKPLKKLVEGTKHIGNGNLDSQIEVLGSDEVGQLATAFNAMASNLKEYIDNLSVAIAEKERINGELSVAANLQNDMLPRIFPIFSDLDSLKIFAKMTPAKEVGGDFYDCFFVNESHTKLCCVMADVSGKGVPASLFMVIAKTILKTNLLADGSIVDAITRANTLLSEDNNSNMFVTTFASLLDLTTGRYEFVNCGHNPPLLGRSGDKFEYMKTRRTLPLAAMEETKYYVETIMLEPGDVVYMYTDGITEAMNEKSELFGNDALVDALNTATNWNPEHLDNLVREVVEKFVGEAEQADDITTLSLQYNK